jgi:hypothetical protein
MIAEMIAGLLCAWSHILESVRPTHRYAREELRVSIALLFASSQTLYKSSKADLPNNTQ